MTGMQAKNIDCKYMDQARNEQDCDRGKRSITVVSPLGQLPPAKRLKQACLPFKVVASVDKKVSSQDKRELINHVETTHATAKHSVIDGSTAFDDVKAVVSNEADSYKENQLPCKEDNEYNLNVTEKGQRPISDFLKSTKGKPHDKTLDELTRHGIRDCHVVLIDLTENSCEFRQDFTQSEQNSDKQPSLDMSSSSPSDLLIEERYSASPSLKTFAETIEVSLMREQSPISSLNNSQAETVSNDTTAAKLDTSMDVPGELANVTLNGPKKIKKLKKIKVDQTIELEKAKLKEERRKIQEERERLKAELCRLRIEKMEQKLREKQERSLQEHEKQEKQRLKAEEKKKKQDALDAKQEEKRRFDEKDQRKNNKAQAAFASFFVRKEPLQIVWEKPKNLGTFLPFQVKENMRLAPIHRNQSHNDSKLTETLDLVLSSQSCNPLYLEEIKQNNAPPRSCSRTWASGDKDIQIIDGNCGKICRKAKLLQFVENIRPPYWGTWCKRSRLINPRNPLKRDEKFLNYDLDSDEEWVDEEPGESLSQSEGEKESEDDYEVDNEFFVPHGYLSGEEVNNEDNQIVSPDTLKAQLKIKEREFHQDRKKKCQQIKPLVFGCIWMDNNLNDVNKVLHEYTAVIIESLPIETRFSIAYDSSKKNSPTVTTPVTGETPACQSTTGSKNSKVLPSEAMPHLIRLTHGNQHSLERICSEFQEFWRRYIIDNFNAGLETSPSAMGEMGEKTMRNLSKVLLRSTIRKVASYVKFPEKALPGNGYAWCVTKVIRDMHGLDELPIPNKWNYYNKDLFSKSIKKSSSKVDGCIKSKVIPPNYVECDVMIIEDP